MGEYGCPFNLFCTLFAKRNLYAVMRIAREKEEIRSKISHRLQAYDTLRLYVSLAENCCEPLKLAETLFGVAAT